MSSGSTGSGSSGGSGGSAPQRRQSMTFTGSQLELQSWYWVSDAAQIYIPCKFLGYGGGQNASLPNVEEGIFQVFDEPGREPFTAHIRSRVVGHIVDEWHLKDIHKDLVKNDDVSEPNILWALRRRYQRDEVYASIGSILIAINPYKPLPALYSMSKMGQYLDDKSGTSIASSNMDDLVDPHIWLIAQNAFNQLRATGQPTHRRQAIIISGESGAGKTEATKKCLQYLSYVASRSASSSSSSPTSSTDAPMPIHTADAKIEDQVLKTNPLLESFGNSKTARNNNSSRFGKWLEIIFRGSERKKGGEFFFDQSMDLTLVGANITQYLLEKSRVVVQAPQERNYHIFYQICADPTMLCLPAKEYMFLNQSGCVTIDGVDDAEDFRETASSLEKLQFSVHDQIAIFSALRAILYLGNIVFALAAQDGAHPSVSFSSSAPSIQIVGGEGNIMLTTAALALGLPPARLAECLTTRTFYVRGEKHICEYTCQQAVDARNALAKEIYGRLFSHVVLKSNQTLNPASSGSSSSRVPGTPGANGAIEVRSSSDLCIGLLDIFGFEIFEHNSFEQLCINYGNEKLQQYFVKFVLKEEQRVYEAEGVPYSRVPPLDNEDVLSLMEARPLGIFSRLDEELKINEGSDVRMLQKLEKDHNSKSAHARFSRDHKMLPAHFEIRHFAGTVRYDCGGFMDKNRDKLHDHLEDLVGEVGTDGASNSAIVLLREILLLHGPARDSPSSTSTTTPIASPTPPRPPRVTSTLATRFQNQLAQLMSVLDQSHPHFVRCIKPNNTKQPDVLDVALTLQQLRYSGVLEAIQIRKGGYPVRRAHREFRQRYWHLTRLFRGAFEGLSDQQRCTAIVRELASRNPAYAGIQVGKSLVFFKTEVLTELEKERAAAGLKSMLLIQRIGRGFPKRIKFKILRAAYRKLLNHIKLGRLRHESNAAALPALIASLAAARQVGLLFSWIVRDGDRLVARLEVVQACVSRMAALIAFFGQQDLLDEFRSTAALIAEEAPLAIDCSEIAELKRHYVVVKERAEALEVCCCI